MAHKDSHGIAKGASDQVLFGAVILNLGLSVFEFVAGAISGSTALIADAAHNTNDAAALLIAYAARKISRKRADKRFTFGYRRAELIGAMIQLTALILVGLYLVYEAVRRLFEPEPLLGGWIMAAAGAALFVDVATAWLLWAMSKGSLNVKAAFLHNLTDAGVSLAVLLGGAAIYWLDWSWIDPLLTLAIAGYILWMSFAMLKRTASILMEGTPDAIGIHEVEAAMNAIEGVESVHHIHVWELDEQHRALEAHVVIGEARSMAEMESFKMAVKNCLAERFSIRHSTLEIESTNSECRAYGISGSGKD